jgi:hypothetical protein
MPENELSLASSTQTAGVNDFVGCCAAIVVVLGLSGKRDRTTLAASFEVFLSEIDQIERLRPNTVRAYRYELAAAAAAADARFRVSLDDVRVEDLDAWLLPIREFEVANVLELHPGASSGLGYQHLAILLPLAACHRWPIDAARVWPDNGDRLSAAAGRSKFARSNLQADFPRRANYVAVSTSRFWDRSYPSGAIQSNR